MTSWKSGNALPTFDCLKLYFIKQIPVCHFELTATLIIINYLSQQLFFFPFPSTTYTKAYKYIWYPNSGASGFKFRFM